ncbi:ATP-binding cassette domain-containing protein [Meridianimarinicoccus aquatilis]|uniref:ATP-binding cassette domain-containing protein n=2 Tax=Meridianimarinicoccus aquatilis TaxID=2552766 RepID=A0A4R6AZV3_9RHOB|nr:ATP-binding cassette domain-containing protein [Fluviibacterium aquatile]
MHEAAMNIQSGAEAVARRTGLTARGLCYDAGGKRLIDGMDISIAAGRRTVVMGANGAGKSVLLRLLHGILSPASGEVLCEGRPLDCALRARQAMVFQRPVLLRRSVRGNLAFALAAKGVPRRDRGHAVADALEQARLTHLADRPARVLSGGEQQRLAVARALIGGPDLLLLDEPTASLDPGSTHAIEELIQNAYQRGVTIVMVTHDAGQARRIADDVVFLNSGRVVEAGPADQVLNAPQSNAARAWLGGRLYLDSTP